MIITPFAYMASQAVVPGWTPADLTNILYWFNTGQGVTESGGAIVSWTDQITGRTLTTDPAGSGMTYTATDSAVNNQPSLYNDGTNNVLQGTFTGDVTNGDVYTMIFIGKPDVIGSATYAIWGGNPSTGGAASELAPYISSPDGADLPGYYRFAINGAGRTNITGTTNTGELIYHIAAFNTPTGVISQYWGTTTPLQSTNWGVSSVDRDPFLFNIGGYTSALQYKGKIVEVVVMKSIPTLSELINLQNYVVNKYSNNIDTDAQAFFDAVEADGGALTVTEKVAVNNLVTDLKGYGLWAQMDAIYPMVGGTSTTQKYNLKDPRDLDAAFRLSFLGGGWTHSATGATPDGSTSYADTFYSPATSGFGLDDAHISYYSRTANDNVASVEMGVKQNIGGSFNGSFFIVPRYAGGGSNNYIAANSDQVGPFTSPTSEGYFVVSRINSTSVQQYKNGSVIQNVSLSSANRATDTIYIGANHLNSAVAEYTNRECAFATIGDGLDSTETSNLYTAVQAFQTTLNREV